jgi:hypothetical protein
MGLGLQEAPCHIWRTDDLETNRRQVIACPAPTPLNRNVVQIGKKLQEIFGYKLEDRCTISPCGELQTAETVVLRDATPDGSEVSDEDKIGWNWYMKKKLCMGTALFASVNAVRC